MLFFIDLLEERECVEGHGRIKHCENYKKLHRKHFIGCQGVKLFLLKYINITTFSTATLITVIITTIPIKFFGFCQ